VEKFVYMSQVNESLQIIFVLQIQIVIYYIISLFIYIIYISSYKICTTKNYIKRPYFLFTISTNYLSSLYLYENHLSSLYTFKKLFIISVSLYLYETIYHLYIPLRKLFIISVSLRNYLSLQNYLSPKTIYHYSFTKIFI
jgi:hypothetical protein